MTYPKFAGTFLILILMLLVVLPVQAFTADSLDITIQPTGDARIQFDYTLNWLENFAVFLRIADPAKELKNALESNLGVPVAVERVTGKSVIITVNNFASVSTKNGVTTIRTPGMSFDEAERILNQYWFAPLINPDFSPATTTITYPDGRTEIYYNKNAIPGTTHTIP